MTHGNPTEPSGPTRYVTPDEFGVGTNFVGGCPECVRGEIVIDVELRYRTLRHPFRGVWRVVEQRRERCRYCEGTGVVMWERRDGAFYPVAR